MEAAKLVEDTGRGNIFSFNEPLWVKCYKLPDMSWKRRNAAALYLDASLNYLFNIYDGTGSKTKLN